MKRLDEKVKDIVEVRSSGTVNDFLVDAAATLDGYHFTDITADLMAKWIDRISNVRPGAGDAMAMAGFRGVGKSHFLAALGAVISRPDLRANISDSHVMLKAQGLSRRHSAVAYVRRGSSDSLLTELRNAIAETLGIRTGDLGDSMSELLRAASGKSIDLPFVLLIDTAIGRQTRVARDDGVILSEIADEARKAGVFVGIALDDDIAGADGINSSIANNFAIDYLDQEHLYKIVNAYVFAKREPMRPILHEIFESYRKELPAFRWSEHRFLSLYPLHPAILEIAPFIRLYLHDFALLSFASEAGIKILGRPANSLIGLDEVFDSIEQRLRSVDTLSDAFSAFDRLDRSVIAKMPVMKRHEAKLVLKGLFLLSFNDEIVTANELSAAMLIFDGAESNSGSGRVAEVLQSFYDTAPEFIRVSDDLGLNKRFGFKLGGEDDFRNALTQAAKEAPANIVDSILLRLTADKYSDFHFDNDQDTPSFDCGLIWRGGIRRGEVVWLTESSGLPDVSNQAPDWRVFVRFPSSTIESSIAFGKGTDFEWRLGNLSGDDVETISRFYVLQTNAAIREKYQDSLYAAIQFHSIAVEKIWQRMFFQDSRLISDSGEHIFTDDAGSLPALSQVLSVMLEVEFESRFPLHPKFEQVLGINEVSLLTEHLFSGSDISNPEVQSIAVNIALPLGLVSRIDDLYLPISSEDLSELPILKSVFEFLTSNPADVVQLGALSKRMQGEPYGLSAETRYLILVSLVAQRRIEFVTSSGDRINQRSLDLHIVWDDIVGIALPSSEAYSSERLLKWATIFTGNSLLRSIEAADARTIISADLASWFETWKRNAVIDRFDQLPDDKLNSGLWRTAANVKKTFGVLAQSIELVGQNTLSIHECLQSVADVFCDSDEEYENKRNDLNTLEDYIGSYTENYDLNRYLIRCDLTSEQDTEGLRLSVMNSLESNGDGKGDLARTGLRETWTKFKANYSSQYAETHDSVLVAGENRKRLDEFLRSDLWSIFSDLSAIPLFGPGPMEAAQKLIRELRKMECEYDALPILETQPYCLCGFSLAKGRSVNSMLGNLSSVVTASLDLFREKLILNKELLFEGLRGVRAKYDKVDLVFESGMLMKFIDEGIGAVRLSSLEIQFLKKETEGFPLSNDLFEDRTQKSFESLSDLLLENKLDRLREIS